MYDNANNSRESLLTYEVLLVVGFFHRHGENAVEHVPLLKAYQVPWVLEA